MAESLDSVNFVGAHNEGIQIGRHEGPLTIYNAPGGLAHRSETPEPLFQCPLRAVSNYVERTQGDESLIKLIFQSLTDAADRPAVTVLLGMGGAGKTQLALRYLAELKSRGTHRALLWIDASSIASVSQSFETVARQCGASISLMSNASQLARGSSKNSFDALEETMNIVHRALERLQPWLMVFDNHDRIQGFEKRGSLRSIRDYWPRFGRGQVLLTSRIQECARFGKTFEIGRMREEEAIRLLFKRNVSHHEDQSRIHAVEVVERLGYLALAVDQAGAYIDHQKLSMEQFLEHFEYRRKRILEQVPQFDWEYQRTLGSSEQDSALSVFTTWELSLRCLSGDEQTKKLKAQFLSLAGFLNPLNLREELFREGAISSSAAPSWSKLFLDNSNWDHFAFGDFVSELLNLSLLESLERTSTGCHFSMHPLLSEWAKLHLSAKLQSEYTSEIAWVVRRSMPEDIEQNDEDKTQEDLQILGTHISACVDACERFLPKGQFLGGDGMEQLAHDFSTFLQVIGMYDLSHRICSRAIEGREKYQKPWNRSYILFGIQIVLFYQKKREYTTALDYVVNLVKVADDVLGPEDELTLWCRSRVGSLLYRFGRLDEAEETLRLTYQKQCELANPNTSWISATLLTWSRIYYELGNYKQGCNLVELAYNQLGSWYGPQHTTRLKVRMELIATYSNLRSEEISEAMIENGRGCLASLHQRFGPLSGVTITASIIVAHIFAKKGRFEEAFDMLRQIIDADRTLTSPDLGDVYFQMTKIAYIAGYYDRADEYCELAVHYYRETGNFISHMGLNACSTRSITLRSKGRILEGEQLWKEIEHKAEARGMASPLVDEARYWGLYWLLLAHSLENDRSRQREVNEYLCKAVQASRSFRRNEFSVIKCLRNAITGFAYLGDGERVDEVSGYLLEAWTHQAQYQTSLRTDAEDADRIAIETPLPIAAGIIDL